MQPPNSALEKLSLTASLNVLLPAPLTGRGPSYTCGMLARSMHGPELSVTVFVPRTRGFSIAPAQVHEALPFWLKRVPYRLINAYGDRKTESDFLDEMRLRRNGSACAYVWPDTSLATVRALRDAGVTVFREMINCHRGTAKIILDEAYKRAGLPPLHSIDDRSVENEQRVLQAVDQVFCPNACVESSLLEHGVERHKLLPASYGWDPARFKGDSKLLPPDDGLTVVFAGTICIRKGAHLLLDYWARSKVRGRLVFAGAIEPCIREKWGSLLARDDVQVMDYVSDVGGLYRSADVFAFPTLEEGGPQVTYEAAGCGLPAITTPMGAGRITRHDREGFVLDPYDDKGWISALQMMAEDRSKRQAMADAAREHADAFQWTDVAKRRRQQILDNMLGATPERNRTPLEALV